MNQICRTCLKSSSKMLKLSNEDDLLMNIEIISSIQISLDNKLYPSTICEECVDNINRFICFRKVIINSDKELKELHSAQSQIKSFEKLNKKLRVKAVKKFKNLEDIKTEISENDCNDDVLEENYQLSVKKCNNIVCSVCNINFPTRRQLYNHKRTVHDAPGVCSFCGVVIRADNLKKHVQMHSQNPVSCKICNKILKNSGSLRSHLIIHKGLSFTCETCGKNFKVKAEYKRHMKLHSDPDINKIMCSICGKCVRDIKKHLLSHTGDRPHTCTHCNKGFTSTYALKIHTRQHTNEKPYVCEYCSTAFPQKVSLLTHLKSKHRQN